MPSWYVYTNFLFFILYEAKDNQGEKSCIIFYGCNFNLVWEIMQLWEKGLAGNCWLELSLHVTALVHDYEATFLKHVNLCN